MSTENIPFHIEINRVIELLSKQIYQSPLSLLRENCQNAFDAILMRKIKDHNFQAKIDIKYDTNRKTIEVSDNGIGMSRSVLKNNFWKAGASGKNNPEAKSAGVVGTFGIGAMANFGIAQSLHVFTKSLEDGVAIESFVEKDKLSATEDCITIRTASFQEDFGTRIIATIRNDIKLDVNQAKVYIENIVQYSDIPIFFNDTLISQKEILKALPPPTDPIWEFSEDSKSISGNITANINIKQYKNSDIWCELKNIYYRNTIINGELLLRQNKYQISTYRSKFALSTTGLISFYGFGGFVNLSILEPTAGREALTTGSLQVLQSIITEFENFISLKIYDLEASANNNGFMNWVVHNKRYDLAGNITINLKPDDKCKLSEIKEQSNHLPFNLYWGTDQNIIEQYSNEGCPLILGSRSNPRKNIEMNYFNQFCKIREVSDSPQITSTKEEKLWSDNEYSFAFKLVNILESDYFVKTIVKYGIISHGLPLLIDTSKDPIEICLNSDHLSIKTVLRMYDSDFMIMSSVVKDFIRNSIFQKIANFVPSSTRRGAEAFLKAIKEPKDIFEYQKEDSASLGDIWKNYMEGKISLSQAAYMSTEIVKSTIQEVNKDAMSKISEQLPDIIKNQEITEKNKQ